MKCNMVLDMWKMIGDNVDVSSWPEAVVEIFSFHKEDEIADTLAVQIERSACFVS